MLESVLYARDKWLNKQTGLLFPQKAIIYMSPCEMNNLYDEKINFWTDVYGFDMSAIMPLAMNELALKPKVDIISPSQLLTKRPICMKEMDLGTVTADDLKYIQCECYIQIDDAQEGQDYVHGFCVWFDCIFEPKTVVLSTSPSAPPTHWKQTIVMLPQPLPIPSSKNLPKVMIQMTPSDANQRHYDISLEIPDAFRDDLDEELDLKDIIMQQFEHDMDEGEDEDAIEEEEE